MLSNYWFLRQSSLVDKITVPWFDSMVSSLFKRFQNVEHCSYNGDDFVQMLLYEKSVSFSCTYISVTCYVDMSMMTNSKRRSWWLYESRVRCHKKQIYCSRFFLGEVVDLYKESKLNLKENLINFKTMTSIEFMQIYLKSINDIFQWNNVIFNEK